MDLPIKTHLVGPCSCDIGHRRVRVIPYRTCIQPSNLFLRSWSREEQHVHSYSHTHTLQPSGAAAQTRNDRPRPATPGPARCWLRVWLHRWSGLSAGQSEQRCLCCIVPCRWLPLRRCRAVDRVPGSHDSYASLGGLSGGARPEGGGLGGVPLQHRVLGAGWLGAAHNLPLQALSHTTPPGLGRFLESAWEPEAEEPWSMGSRGLKLLLAVLSMLLLPRCSGYVASRLAVQAARRPGAPVAACSRLVCSGAVEAPTPTAALPPQPLPRVMLRSGRRWACSWRRASPPSGAQSFSRGGCAPFATRRTSPSWR